MNFDSRDYVEQARESAGNIPANPAGFLLRLVAYIIDAIIFAVPTAIVLAVLIAAVVFATSSGGGSESASSAGSGAASCLICLMYPAVFIAILLYNAGFESSRFMATPGKMLVGIRVTDLDGNRISFGKAFLRVLCKYIFNMFFWVGSLYILISDKKQGLYDVVAGTLVVKKD